VNEQIAREFAAAHQYVAIGAYYDSETFPQLSRFFYDQADEERGHAMRMINYWFILLIRALMLRGPCRRRST
jgi:ferritin